MTIYHRMVLAMIWLISLLPFRILYFLSDILAFLLYALFRYRKEVVFSNLRNAFPEKSQREIRSIARKFYRNFSDLLLEVMKTRSITQEQLTSRVRFHNFELVEQLYMQKKSIILTIGHCGNWEWMTQVLEMKTSYSVWAVVKPLADKEMDRYLTALRTKFNTSGGLIPFMSAPRVLFQHRHMLTINVFAGDQTPTFDEINYWTTFLHQETPFFLGIERLSRSMGFAVLFFDVQRCSRGIYDVRIRLLEDDPQKTADYEITGKYVNALEEVIRSHPDNWLWSHRRWKHKKPAAESCHDGDSSK